MKCVVIGGSIAGISAITGIRKAEQQASKGKKNSDNDDRIQITLIEPKHFLEVYWATYRLPFDEDMAEKCLFELSKYCVDHQVTHIHSVVTKLNHNAKTVTLSNGDIVDYDVCIVAVGADCNWKGCGRGPDVVDVTKIERKVSLKKEGEQILDAKQVVIVGGGLIGTELAADIAYYKKERNIAKKKNKEAEIPIDVTIVHSGDFLCHYDMSEYASKVLKTKLEKLGVKIILNDKATIQKDDDDDDDDDAGVSAKQKQKLVLEKSGETLVADRVIRTVGNIEVNRRFIDEELLDNTGLVKVDEYFRVSGIEDGTLFSIGDCCNLLPNQASAMFTQVPIIGYNVLTTLKAISTSTTDDKSKLKGLKLKKHIKHKSVFVNTVGPKDGVAYLGFMTLTWMIPSFKNKTMFIFKVKDELQI